MSRFRAVLRYILYIIYSTLRIKQQVKRYAYVICNLSGIYFNFYQSKCLHHISASSSCFCSSHWVSLFQFFFKNVLENIFWPDTYSFCVCTSGVFDQGVLNLREAKTSSFFYPYFNILLERNRRSFQ